MMRVPPDHDYIVITKKEFDSLSLTNRNLINGVLDKLDRDRERAGADSIPGYLVCSTEEPYAAEVFNAIKKGIKSKEKQNGNL